MSLATDSRPSSCQPPPPTDALLLRHHFHPVVLLSPVPSSPLSNHSYVRFFPASTGTTTILSLRVRLLPCLSRISARVPLEPPPTSLLLSSELASPFLFIPSFPPPLASATSIPLHYLQVMDMRFSSLLSLDLVGGVDFSPTSSYQFLYPQMLVAAVCSLVFDTGLDYFDLAHLKRYSPVLPLVRSYCLYDVGVIHIVFVWDSKQEELWMVKELWYQLGVFLYLSDHISSESDLPQFEDEIYLPQYEDIINLPQYEDATSLPQFELVFKQALSSLANELASLYISCLAFFKARRYLAKEVVYQLLINSSKMKILPQRPTYNGSNGYCFISSVVIAEALALKTAIVAAPLAHIPHLSMFPDSQVLVNLLTSSGMSTEPKSVLSDIQCLLPTFESILVFYVSRSANVQAVSMAKVALNYLVSSSE